MSKYTEMANQLRERFLSEFDVEDAKLRQARMRELNAPSVIVDAMLTPSLNFDHECIVTLVSELDGADAKRTRQIKYQLKNYYHFTLSTQTYSPKEA